MIYVYLGPFDGRLVNLVDGFFCISLKDTQETAHMCASCNMIREKGMGYVAWDRRIVLVECLVVLNCILAGVTESCSKQIRNNNTIVMGFEKAINLVGRFCISLKDT